MKANEIVKEYGDLKALNGINLNIEKGRIVLHGVTEELRIQKGKSIDELYKEVYKSC